MGGKNRLFSVFFLDLGMGR